MSTEDRREAVTLPSDPGSVLPGRLEGVVGPAESAAASAISTARLGISVSCVLRGGFYRQTSSAFLASPVLFAILMEQRRMASYSTIFP